MVSMCSVLRRKPSQLSALLFGKHPVTRQAAGEWIHGHLHEYASSSEIALINDTSFCFSGKLVINGAGDTSVIKYIKILLA